MKSLIYILPIILIFATQSQFIKTQYATGKTTRYWDCCKASCSWSGKAQVTKPVQTCSKDGVMFQDNPNLMSVCNGGNSYMCNNNQPYIINDNVSIGFAAAHISGQFESNWCCACYEMIFTSGTVIGKTFVVQVTNTGGDLGENHFDLQIPGGGVGIFNGCKDQWGAPDNGWGDRYGGVTSLSQCRTLPIQLQAGCEWRFNWFKNADNPTMKFRRVKCPKQLTDRTQCIRQDDNNFPDYNFQNNSTNNTNNTDNKNQSSNNTNKTNNTNNSNNSNNNNKTNNTNNTNNIGNNNQSNNENKFSFQNQSNNSFDFYYQKNQTNDGYNNQQDYSNCNKINQQCAGLYFYGQKCCTQGLQCFKKDDYYSQCLESCPQQWGIAWACQQGDNKNYNFYDDLNPKCVNLNQKCGGFLYNGTTCCNQRSTCFKQSIFYSQCLYSCPNGWDCQKANTTSGSTLKIDQNSIKCAQQNEQCGGQNFNGNTCCQLPSLCQKKDQYYSQCLTSCPKGWQC